MDLVDPRKGVLVGRRSPYPEKFRNDAVALYRAAGGKRTALSRCWVPDGVVGPGCRPVVRPWWASRLRR
ncbi:hypothetical protein F8144_29960 [Streptomyces triticiradicis]|uniref:Uncharacterized protein n=1 Tax=Streptomyces triticiradicis TaxID=2651189 RepID=A0A7J5DB27_9ACTN|nr:hypothetical protein F8144_29960 [Streptomyces triticiradicis]